MAGIYQLEDIKEYFKNKIFQDELFTTEIEQRIEECYSLISNPKNRVNDVDEQWVAYVTQASENTTVVDAIEEITDQNGYNRTREVIIEVVDEVGEEFKSLNIDLKPRIPFYICVLDKLIP